MYSSRGSNNVYGQDQPYSSQSSYAPQSLAASSLMGGAHGRPSASATAQPPQHYGGEEYNPVYGSSKQQISPLGKGPVATSFEGRSNYGSSMPESPKFTANDYVPSSSRGYGQKVDQLYSDRPPDYPSVERRQYADRHSAYLGRELPSETANRYTESVAFGHEHQSKIYDRMDQATVIRQEEMLNARALQPASIDGQARQADYLAARAAVRHPAQDPIAYGGRLDPELRSLSMLTGPPYGGNHPASILGAAPRNLDDLIYTHTSSNPGYGVSLPPGRDYGVRKGLHGTSFESDYPTGMLGRHLILDDHKDDRALYSRDLERRDKDLDYLREREKDREREREKDRLRERERERERDRERQREREREKERERERERERREKERDREHKRRLELKRELTPPRASKDRRASSLAKDVRPLRRASPRHEVLHRHISPVKEKRRDYSCKVFSFSFVEAKRDFLSLDKRYPRLYVSPECSKVVVNWPRKNLRLSLNTPVSFEHDFVEATVLRKESPSTQHTADISGTGGHSTVWNAKIILMSGLGENSQAELSSERTYNDRIPHFCNLLRFAILKKNSSLMAIGGPWHTVDGGDPSVDDSSLVKTALRYAKDVANLDLRNCQHWNRFLEIHYDRIGKDGLFSHREITVLYVPDLSDCLPSLDSWRENWFNHRKAVSEREILHSSTKEVHGDKTEVQKDKKKHEHPKESKVKTEFQKKKEASVENKESSGQSGVDSKKGSDANKLKGKESLVSAEVKVKEKDKVVENKDVIESTEDEKNVPEKVQEGNFDSPTAVIAKTGKKRIVKRIVKRKVAKKKDATENSTEKNDEIEKVRAGVSNIISEVDGSSNNTPAVVKTFVRKKVVKKQVDAVALEKDESSILAVTPDKVSESAADKEKVKPEDSSAVVQEGSTKTTVKKKIVKRVAKRKAPTAETVAEDDVKGEKMIQLEDIKVEHNEEAVEKEVNKAKPDKKEDPKVDKKEISVYGMETDSTNQKASQNGNRANSKEKKELKDEKERKNRVDNESRSKTSKTEKEKKKSDEPPKHPGLILQTKGSKSSKLQSLSLSLDSLLDYNDKDIEESTFELSVFAETFHEMLQYDMGCRLLAFLQKLRIKFVAKRNKAKRQREESSKKENEESSSKKRTKSGNVNEDVKPSKTEDKSDNMGEDEKSIKTENADDAHHDDSKTIKEETKSGEQVDTSNIEDEIEEDPEEDPEEDEQMPDAIPHCDSDKKENTNAVKNAGDPVAQDVAPTEQNEKQKQEAAKETPETISTPDPSNKDKSTKLESKPKEAPRVVNKELLQAFRFFDRNRVGYIRVEDLRLIIHNLGKFLSHRDVKELVQSALLESNTGRDDRILYEKLVKL